MALFRKKSARGGAPRRNWDPDVAEGQEPRPGLLIGGHRLPDITVATLEDQALAAARADSDGTTRYAFQHDVLTQGRENAPGVLGYQDRAMVWLVLNTRACPNLDKLNDDLRSDGARLYVQPLTAGRFGLVESCIRLPGIESGYVSVCALTHGYIQTFLDAAHRTRTVELQIAHREDKTVLAYSCRADGVDQVLDGLVGTLSDYRHPRTNADEREAFTRLRRATEGEQLPDREDALIRLTPTAVATPYVLIDVPG